MERVFTSYEKHGYAEHELHCRNLASSIQRVAAGPQHPSVKRKKLKKILKDFSLTEVDQAYKLISKTDKLLAEEVVDLLRKTGMYRSSGIKSLHYTDIAPLYMPRLQPRNLFEKTVLKAARGQLIKRSLSRTKALIKSEDMAKVIGKSIQFCGAVVPSDVVAVHNGDISAKKLVDVMVKNKNAISPMNRAYCAVFIMRSLEVDELDKRRLCDMVIETWHGKSIWILQMYAGEHIPPKCQSQINASIMLYVGAGETDRAAEDLRDSDNRVLDMVFTASCLQEEIEKWAIAS